MPWEPLPTADGAGPPPRRVSESLDRLLAGAGGPPSSALAAVFERWAEVVGAAIAAHARPLALRHQTLVVQVDDPAWASELRWLEPELLRQLARVAGAAVARIDVRVGADTGAEGKPWRGRRRW